MRHGHRVTNIVGKMVPIDLLVAGLPEDFNLYKKHSICEAQ